jgi:hypothetical protein
MNTLGFIASHFANTTLLVAAREHTNRFGLVIKFHLHPFQIARRIAQLAAVQQFYRIKIMI